MVADELRRQADHFMDLDQLAGYIQRDGYIPAEDDEDYDEEIPSVRTKI